MRRADHRRLACLAAAILGLASLPAGPAGAQEKARAISTATQRQSLELTLYDAGFALVRDVRRLVLGRGELELDFRDVAGSLQPESVLLEAPALRVLEQSFRYDVLSRERMLERYLGRRVRIYRWSEKAGREEAVDATVLSTRQGLALRIGDEISFDVPGRIAFPDLPADLVTEPTLIWRVDSGRERQEVAASYLATGLGWHADYLLALDAGGHRGALHGWVTLENESGSDFPDARIDLVAGTVQKLPSAPAPPRPLEMARATALEAGAAGAPRAVGEVYLYPLEGRYALADGESHQVPLLAAPEVPVRQRLVLRAPHPGFRAAVHTAAPLHAAVELEFDDAESAGLGLPLPRGVVRVYAAEADGARRFLGEDRIDHTPVGETVRLQTGQSFDVLGERRQVGFERTGECTSESSWLIELRNRKPEAVVVEVEEPMSGDWKLLESDPPGERRDTSTLRFAPEVPAGGTLSIRYRIRSRWC